MERLPVLIHKRFRKSLPRENRQAIIKKINSFLGEWQQNPDEVKRHKGYSVRTVKADTKIANIQKFRVNKGERILFIDRQIDDVYQGTCKSIILLAFCKHDIQIEKAKNISMPELELLYEDSVEEISEWLATEIEYDQEYMPLGMIKHIPLESYIEMDNLKGAFYLNEQQRDCLSINYEPLILLGSAGSGKTTIGIYKLIQLVITSVDLYEIISIKIPFKIDYLTYSKPLCNDVKETYHTIYQNELGREEKQEAYTIDFSSVNDWFEAHAKKFMSQEERKQLNKGLVDFETFNVLFYQKERANFLLSPEYRCLKSIEVFDLWREIRGVIKGYTSKDWKPRAFRDKMIQYDRKNLLDEDYYLQEHFEASFFTKEVRAKIYKVAQRYVKWLQEEGRYDENDLALILWDHIDQMPKSDWLIIDEVQDLTEVQCAVLFNIVKDKRHLLISGDYNQTISPTYFDTKRILTFLTQNNLREVSDRNLVYLTDNYRNPLRIVDAANHLASIRHKVFGIDKRNDFGDEKARQLDIIGRLYTLSNNTLEKQKLLDALEDKAYVSVVVPTEGEKKKFGDPNKVPFELYTLSEVKGIENRCIIVVNLFTYYRKEWEQLYEALAYEQEVKETNFLRYLFNMLYVALTRSREMICFIDDEIDIAIYDHLLTKHHIKHQTVFNQDEIGLGEKSSIEDQLQRAGELEIQGKYKEALMIYHRIANLGIDTVMAIKRCEAKQAEDKKMYKDAGDRYLELYHLGDAIGLDKACGCYRRLEDKVDYYTCLLEKGKEAFIEEVVLQPTYSYEEDIIPYLKGELKTKIQCIGLGQYASNINRRLEALEAGLEWSNETLDQIRQRIERIHNERSTDE